MDEGGNQNLSEKSSHRKVVIAYDGSHNAEDAFKWYLKSMHKEDDYVIVVHVPEFSKLTQVSMMTADASLMTKLVEEENLQTRLLVDKVRELLRLSKVQGEIKDAMGDPGEEIVRVVVEEGVDLVITGSRGLGTIRRTIMGSVSDYIVHHSPVPVLVCKLPATK